MVTIKSYTDIEQSKKLAEILSHESADMFHFIHEVDTVGFGYKKDAAEFYSKTEFEYIPCWSLAALFGVIRETIGYTLYGVNNVYMSCNLGDKPWKLETEVYDNEVDACVAMIEKLNELNML